MLKRPLTFWLLALLLGWGFDFLFWNKGLGISVPIFVVTILGVGFFLAWREGVRPARASLVLVIPILFLAFMTFLREEPLTLLVDAALLLLLMALLALSFVGGRWPLYSLADYAWGLLRLGGSAFSRASGELARSRKPEEAEPDSQAAPQPGWASALFRSQAAPIGRGLLFALPVVVIFAALLASADPIFSARLDSLLMLFRIQNLPEYFMRLLLILGLAYLLAGIFLHAFFHSQEEKLLGLETPWFKPFFGLTEAVVILGSVDLLFLAFVAIQVRYFFGGQANISLESFTYAEYARRGFGELVAVAFFSLLLFLGLSVITHLEQPRGRRLFSGLGVALVALVSVILVSAFQRLLLYEQVYGFTRLRTYTHVFMVWLGLLLVGVVVLQLASRLRIFPAVALTAALGFAVTLSVMNVDGWIARENVARAQAGESLDFQYLNSLSADALPVLAELSASPVLPDDLRAQLNAALACQTRLYLAQDSTTWQAYRYAPSRAAQILAGLKPALEAYSIQLDSDENPVVWVGDTQTPCFGPIQDP